MIDLVKIILCEMKFSVKERFVPNYFVCQYNMFDVLKENEAKVVLEKIENVEKI